MGKLVHFNILTLMSWMDLTYQMHLEISIQIIRTNWGLVEIYVDKQNDLGSVPWKQ